MADFHSFDSRTFQSTLPARGATPVPSSPVKRPAHFNPRSPHGERHALSGCASYFPNFNPRSPHGERQTPRRRYCRAGDFNPRSPHGERRRRTLRRRTSRQISIHAPRTGSDIATRIPVDTHSIISIYAPRTGSDIASYFRNNRRWRFQSTLPARGATARSGGIGS